MAINPVALVLVDRVWDKLVAEGYLSWRGDGEYLLIHSKRYGVVRTHCAEADVDEVGGVGEDYDVNHE